MVAKGTVESRVAKVVALALAYLVQGDARAPAGEDPLAHWLRFDHGELRRWWAQHQPMRHSLVRHAHIQWPM